MKPSKLIPALILTLPLAWATSAFAGDEKPAETPLPTSCTLLTILPADRAAHLERLKLLQRASAAVVVTPEGFHFKVDLQTMPFKELQSGLTLAEIRAMLCAGRVGTAPRQLWRTAATTKLAMIDRRIAELHASRASLVKKLAGRCRTLARCERVLAKEMITLSCG